MQIDLTKYDFTDPLPALMLNAYLTAKLSKAPCELCNEHPEQEGKRVHFHGSDVGACPRKTYFNMSEGKSEDIDGVKGAFLQDGHLHEAMMLESLGTKFEIYAPKNSCEVRITIPMTDDKTVLKDFVENKERVISTLAGSVRTFLCIGHIDGWLVGHKQQEETIIKATARNAEFVETYTETNTALYLLECKAVKDYTWNEVKKGIIKDEWYGQMQFYMFAMDIKRAYLLVKHRHTSELMKPIRIDFDPDWMMKKLKMMVNIYKFVNLRREVPKPEKKKASDAECKFCNFNRRCY